MTLFPIRPLHVLIAIWLLMSGQVGVAGERRPALTLGVVPQFDARRIQDIWQPIIAALRERTGLDIVLSPSPSIPVFEERFAAGEFDLVYMNPYHLLVANHSQGYAPLVRDIGSQLFGIVVVRKDSPITKVEELDGEIVAFPAPNALGAALIPRAEFATRFDIAIVPKYVNSHTSSYLNVVTGQAAAGGGVQRTLNKQKPNVREQLRVLYETPKIAPHPLAVHPRLARETVDALEAALLDMAKTDEGKTLFAQVPISQLGKASIDDYFDLGQMGLDEFYVR